VADWVAWRWGVLFTASERVRSGADLTSLLEEEALDSALLSERLEASVRLLPFSDLDSLADLVACG
jgi:hypothetical protein